MEVYEPLHLYCKHASWPIRSSEEEHHKSKVPCITDINPTSEHYNMRTEMNKTKSLNYRDTKNQHQSNISKLLFHG